MHRQGKYFCCRFFCFWQGDFIFQFINIVTLFVNGYRVSRRYYYYTKREALAMFRREVLANA
jgi:hypothetical protein